MAKSVHFTIRAILFFFLLLPMIVAAQVGGMENPGLNLAILGVAIGRVVWVAFTIIAVIAFIVAGVQFLTSQGDPEKISRARLSFIWGIAGIIVGIVAYSIILIVGNSLIFL